jgi:hypothetical protein
MATTTNNRGQQDQQGRHEQAGAHEAREARSPSTETTEQALSQLVQAWADAVRSFVPSAYLRPAEALDRLYDFTLQLLSLQRRLYRELLGATGSTVRSAQDRAGLDEDAERGRERRAS